MIALLALLALQDTSIVQERAQHHRTANVTLSNGTVIVWSVDSGGARQVFVDARALTTDSILGFNRGGTFTLPLADMLSAAALIEQGMDRLALGDSIPEWSQSNPVGTVRTATIRCLSTGCTLTITNRSKAGVTRAGSWTTARLSVGLIRELAAALREAALHQSGAVVVVPR